MPKSAKKKRIWKQPADRVKKLFTIPTTLDDRIKQEMGSGEYMSEAELFRKALDQFLPK